MVFSIIVFIISGLGIYGFYNDILALTYIGFGFCLYEQIGGYFYGANKTLFPMLLGGMIGWVITGNFLLGFAIGVCIENVIFYVLGMIYIIVFAIINSKNQNPNELINQLIISKKIVIFLIILVIFIIEMAIILHRYIINNSVQVISNKEVYNLKLE